MVVGSCVQSVPMVIPLEKGQENRPQAGRIISPWVFRESAEEQVFQVYFIDNEKCPQGNEAQDPFIQK